MSSKKVQKTEKLEKIGLYAKKFIEENHPEVVIVSDDNAIKYVLKNHYKDSKIPFVFCGLNNSGKDYLLPYSNTTGMVEKNPREKLLKLLFNQNPAKTHVVLMTTLGTTASRDVAAFHELVKKLQIESSAFEIHNQEDWRKIYKQLQEDPNVDIIYFSNRAAFKEWDHKKNLEWILQHNNKITFTTQDWMMPYVAIGMNKIAGEQGIWAGEAALEILNGTPPSVLEVVPSQNYQLWINPLIAKPFKNLLPDNISSQATIYYERGLQ
jgi:ABC-type uncharacterized transport system substrate-binding protein